MDRGRGGGGGGCYMVMQTRQRGKKQPYISSFNYFSCRSNAEWVDKKLITVPPNQPTAKMALNNYLTSFLQRALQ